MKHLLKIILLLLPALSFAQDVIFNPPGKKQIDSLQLALPHEHNDTLRMFITDQLGSYNVENNTSKAVSYHKQELALARKLGQRLWEAKALENLSYSTYLLGDYLESLRLANAGIAIAENNESEKGVWKVTLFAKDGDAHKARIYLLAGFYEKLGYLYAVTGNDSKTLSSYAKAIQIAETVDDKVGLSFYNGDLEDYYMQKGKLDSALIFINRALQNIKASGYQLYKGALLADIGQIYFRKGNYITAKQYYFESIKVNREQNNQNFLLRTYLLLADLYQSTGKSDSGIYYAKLALRNFKVQGAKPKEINATYNLLFTAYKSQGRNDSAFFYLQRSKILSDSLNQAEITKINQYLNEGFNNQLKVEELEKDKIRVQTRIRTYILIAGIIICLIIAFLLYRNSRNRRKANFLLSEQKEEIATQRDNLEEKNRELEIETALERVRTVAMGMMKPDDLLEICETMFHELKKLGFADLRNAMINVHYDDKKHLLNYDYSGSSGKTITNFAYNSHPIVDNIINHARQSSEGFTEMIYSGKALDEWRIFRKNNGEPDDEQFDNIDALYYYFYSIGNGAIGISNFSGVDPEQLNILKKFRNVFDLAYKRYIDIATAEAQVREAQIELALERVRARTMAMQHSSELKDAASILFQQVEALGVNTWTSGFQLWDEDRKAVTVWTCTAGVVQQAFRLPVTGDDFFMMHIIGAEQNGEAIYVEEIRGKALENHYSYMAALPGLKDNFASLSDAGIALPLSQVNHAAFFTYGYLLFITYLPMPEAHDIFKRFAKVFDQTYTRFLDLQKSEALALRAKEDLILLQTEKKRAEDALTELKATQAQLIQSEKMASLGELTAGIAHEIQNPLNFVNNFSEVNHEMIDELEEELKAGNIDEALAIAADIKQNEEKISHHGKRADGIVKGMLQHSRTGGGEKQLTNMNVLADEFLRLSYHGLRAKDKTFNAEMITHFDPELPEVNVLPQDMGRVLLNLFNNAFYAVNQKAKSSAPDYKPEVSIATSSENGHVIIKVKDNGVGIPDAIKEKIMQPFFTTKPTGEGTGLGLSLSYDIVVKGHGGNIQLESTVGEGSEFIIILHNQI